jgi:hypothetical protein
VLCNDRHDIESDGRGKGDRAQVDGHCCGNGHVTCPLLLLHVNHRTSAKPASDVLKMLS